MLSSQEWILSLLAGKLQKVCQKIVIADSRNKRFNMHFCNIDFFLLAISHP